MKLKRLSVKILIIYFTVSMLKKKNNMDLKRWKIPFFGSGGLGSFTMMPTPKVPLSSIQTESRAKVMVQPSTLLTTVAVSQPH